MAELPAEAQRDLDGRRGDEAAEMAALTVAIALLTLVAAQAGTPLNLADVADTDVFEAGRFVELEGVFDRLVEHAMIEPWRPLSDGQAGIVGRLLVRWPEELQLQAEGALRRALDRSRHEPLSLRMAPKYAAKQTARTFLRPLLQAYGWREPEE